MPTPAATAAILLALLLPIFVSWSKAASAENGRLADSRRLLNRIRHPLRVVPASMSNKLQLVNTGTPLLFTASVRRLYSLRNRRHSPQPPPPIIL